MTNERLDNGWEKRVFLAKKRPLSNPLPLHIADRSWLTELVHLNNKAEALMDGFWPGALTIILLKKDVVPDIVTAGFTKVGLRMPDNPIALELIRAVGRPIIGTSANITGFPSPTKASDVEKYLKDTVELILDGGVCQIGLESTILDLTEDIPKLLRRGGLAIEKIESLIVEVVTVCNTLLI